MKELRKKFRLNRPYEAGTYLNLSRRYLFYLFFIFCILLLLMRAVMVYAQGVIIPVGTTININTGQLRSSGDIEVRGTVQTTTGTVATAGDWNNDQGGTYTSNTGTLEFYGTSGTQILDSGGIGAGHLFYNLTHTGAGTVVVDNSNNINVDNNFVNSAGTFDTNGVDMTVAGDWTQGATAVFDPSTATVTFDGTNQFISADGTANFYNFVKSVVSADTITFAYGGGTLTGPMVSNSLTMTGVSGDRLTITGDSPMIITQSPLSLLAGGLQILDWLAVGYNDASGGLELVPQNSFENPGGTTTNWAFGGATLIWEGDVSDDWDVALNWNLGFVPTPDDTARIPDVTGGGDDQPILSSAVVIDSLIMETDATVTLFGHSINITDTLDNQGTLFLFGRETVSITNVDIDSGTFEFTGDFDGLGESFDLPDFGAGPADIDYFNIIINSSTAPADTFTVVAGEELIVAGSLTVTASVLDVSANINDVVVSVDIIVNGGTLTATNGTLDVGDDVILTGGTLTAPGSGQTFTVGGDFDHSTAGTFAHSSGTLVFDGSMQSITGDVDTIFSSFTKQATATDTLTFTTSATQTYIGTFIMRGVSAGQLLTINSDTPGTHALKELLPGGLQDLEFLMVGDSDASAGGGPGLTLVGRNSVEVPIGSTINWDFGATTVTWDGSVDDDWDDPNNWDLGLVPQAIDSVIIPSGTPNNPMLSTDVTVFDMTVDPTMGGGVTVTLDGNDLTITGTLVNNGNIIVTCTETVTIATPDTDSGIFTYTGITNGIADACIISEIGAIDYFNLVINDTQGLDTFSTTDDLRMAGSFNVTGGIVDISTGTDDLRVDGTLTVDGGTLTATDSDIDANGSIDISSGTFNAPDDMQTFTMSGAMFDFADATATFTNNLGEITFDSTTTTTIDADEITLFDFTSSTPGQTLLFADGSNINVDGTFSIAGTDVNRIVLDVVGGGTDWNITITADQAVLSVNVSNSNALPDPGPNVINCFNCIDGGNNNVNWVFALLAITVPEDGKTVDPTPTIIGQAPLGSVVSIVDEGMVTRATVTADANGNFRVEVDPADAFTVGAHTITPEVLGVPGGTINIIVADPPGDANQPTITSHSDGDRVIDPLPTISGRGRAGETVVILAADRNDILLLTVVATGVIGPDEGDGAGTYSVTLTTALAKDINDLSATVDGVASNIIDVLVTDPWGFVFDSAANNPINDATVTLFSNATGLPAVPGGELHSTDVNPFITGTDGLFGFLAVAGDYSFTVTADNYTYPSIFDTFPDGRVIVTGSKGEVLTVVDNVVQQIDQPMDATANLIRIEKDVNKKEVIIGEVVTYTVTLENIIDEDVFGVFLKDKIPPGFKYLKNRVILNDAPIQDPAGTRPVTFDIGRINVGEKKTLKYQLVVGSGVTVGDYQNVAVAVNAGDLPISNTATETVKVILDPLFDLGTVIGKVFFDKNENGIQDAPEYSPYDREMIAEDPVPNVKIAMEDGTVITTDSEGRFSVPALIPGRHLFRVDERSLPDGSYLTTDKVVVVNITPGIMVKVNFGVNMDYERYQSVDQVFFTNRVKVSQDQGKAQPRLNVSLFGDDIAIYDSMIVEKTEFRIFTNYAPYIKRWKLEIIDKDTKKLIQHFEGDALNIHDPIFWDGKNNQGDHIRLDRNYSYLVYVEDAEGNFDETNPKDLVFRKIVDEQAVQAYRENGVNKYEGYRKWIEEESRKNNLAVQTILVDGETIYIDRLDANLQNVSIFKSGKLVTEVPIIEKHGLTAKELLEGKLPEDKAPQTLEVILPSGEYEILVQEILDEGEKPSVPVRLVEGALVSSKELGKPVKTYTKSIQVGDDRLFFVAMGDATVGYTFTSGDVEPVQHDDKFTEGFYAEGKLAYYIKGKILGKYIITSSFDSERDKKELFRNIEKDKYYPVYGDASKIDYQATDTQGQLYLMLEWDKSSVLWGNYSIGFDKTEFARFSRTLYGGKVDFETVSTTKYGDARSKVVLFRAKAQQKSAHNEFLATGGSLYFLKHREIIEGSDKVRIEVRDKISGLVVTQREMVEGADYEMDYSNGRIIFWQPIPQLVDSLSIISNELLEGNLVYMIADYEYDVQDKIAEDNVGARIRQAVTDQVLIGGTYIRENLQDSNYILRGADVTLRLGPDATVVGEYAVSESEVQGTFVSTDGGLTFTELSTDANAEGRAYGIKGDARLFNRLAISSHYKWVENDFSSSATTAQQGKQQIGFQAIFDINDKSRITARHDIQQLIEGGSQQTKLQVGALKTTTTMLQIVHEFRKLKLTAEYKKQEVVERLDEFDTQTNKETDSLALRADYDLVTDRLEVSVEQQVDVDDDSKSKTTIGVKAKPTDQLEVTVEETFSKEGSATKVGATAAMNERLDLRGEYTLARNKEGTTSRTSSVGVTAKLNEKLKVKTDLAMNQPTDGDSTTTLTVGGSAQIKEGTQVQTDIALIQSESGVGKTTITLGGTSQVDDLTKINTQIGLSESGDQESRTVSFGGTSQVNEKTRTESKISISESTADGKKTSYMFGTKTRLSEEIELASTKTFGTSPSEQSTDETYSLIRSSGGKKLEGSFIRKYKESTTEISDSNIFGLSGDINDRWALTGQFERGDVNNLDGTQTDRKVYSLAAGYVKTDKEMGTNIKSSTKVEYRLDEGVEDKTQYLFRNTTEGRLTRNLSIFTKLEFSSTRNRTKGFTETRHKEIVLGGAYRPVQFDRLNLIGRYTYLEGKSPTGQVDETKDDVQEEITQVYAFDAIYDLSEKWQLTEKFAYRIMDEKVAGFDFTKTHTWLMIHRLNYNINRDWTLGGEFRILTQEEAQDAKRGFLLEAARRVGEYAQLGFGYNFTDFVDDLTSLDYTAQGPFVRLTGKFYDRTPEEIERARQKWIEERISHWAWAMVQEELYRQDSPILNELNAYFDIAERAFQRGQIKESRQILKDIIIAGEMMFEEAAEHIRNRIEQEENLREMKKLADQYYQNGQYQKAKEILEKILEEAQLSMLQ